MKTKNTILSQKDLRLLEEIVLRYGKVVSFDHIWQVMARTSSVGAVRKRVGELTQAGWLVRLRKGLYLVVTDISSLGFTDVSELTISQSLNPDSYISFEAALQHHGLFDQMLSRVNAVTTRITKSYRVLETTYTFSHIKGELYFGYTQETINHQNVNVAEKEKAILDLLYFRSSDYAITLVMEKLRDYQDQFDFTRLKQYSTRYSRGMVRKVGFLLDHFKVNTDDLLVYSREIKNSYNKLTPNARQFNAKWRLYYDPKLVG